MQKHPDEEIQEAHRAEMNVIARVLDQAFNPDLENKKLCFVLLLTEFGSQGRCNYISNGERKDIVLLLKEMVARFEGQPELKGTA